MTPDTLYKLAPPLIVLQFTAFGWRVNRELNLSHAERGTFVLIPDVLNTMSLFAAVTCLIVLPIATDMYLWLSRMILAGGYVLIASIHSRPRPITACGAEKAFAGTPEMATTTHTRLPRNLFHLRYPLS